MTWTLATFRERVAQALLVLAFLHVPLLALVIWSRDGEGLLPVGFCLVLAVGALALYRAAGVAIVTRLVISLVLIGQVSLLVFSFAGSSWQPDMHMYYFAVLAILAGFCDWRPIVLGAAVTALHHLVLQFALPSAVFYQGGSLGRVLLHAVIVVIETGFLATFAVILARSFALNEASLAMAQEVANRERAATESEKRQSDFLGQRAEVVREVVNGFREQMSQAMGLLDRSAEAMNRESQALTGASHQSRQQTTLVSIAASETMQGIDQLAAASNQLAASINEIGRNAVQSAKGSKAAVDLTRRASIELKNLNTSSDDVGAVVEIIRGIAGKTSMLALNATIEAARAGEMGRGFAVVANEVKLLSAQTAKATDQVAEQINAMQDASQRSLQVILEIVDALGEIERVADVISLAVNEQGHATSEIARQVHVSFEGARRGADVVGSFETMTFRTHAAAEALQTTADALAGKAREVRRDVEAFCERIAAG